MGQYRIVTASATMDNTESVIIFNSAAAINFTLLPALGDGREFLLKNIGAGAVTLLPYGSDLIDSGSSKVLSQGGSQVLFDYGEESWMLTEDAIVTGDLTAALGSAPTPVARNNNPIIGGNTINANIDALDAAIGITPTLVIRTNNPIVNSNACNANISLLDSAIGADLTPAGTRTAGTVAVANTVNQNIDALDAAIGFEAQMSGTPNVVVKTGTVFQALDKLDTLKSVQTVKKTIGGVGVAACDFNFTTAEDQVEQVIDLGEIIPAFAKIFNTMTKTDAVFTGAVSLVAETGTTSSGAELIASATIYAANAITEQATGGLTPIATTATAKHIYVSATPGANWNLVTAGKVSVYVTFINVTNI